MGTLRQAPPVHLFRSSPPLPPGPLIGREREVSAALEQLQRGVRLLTFVGPGGIGKTCLALEVVARMAQLSAGNTRIAFVDLADVRDPAGVAPALGLALGVRDAQGPPVGVGDEVRRLVEALEPREHLLLLDNFEQVVEAAPLLSHLLEQAPGLRLIVTSRTPLRLRWEYEFPVPPLAVPRQTLPPNQPSQRRQASLTDQAVLTPQAGDAAEPELDAARQSPAVQLFVRRAQAVRPDFRLTKEDAPTIAAICRRLDGLPLAIELAAASSRVLTPEALNGGLAERRLDLLSGGPRDAHSRQRTLRDTIEWSVSLLAPEDRVLLRQLSVFVGGATLSAIAAVCPAAGPPSEAIHALLRLVEQSLVQPQESHNAEPRFGLLETIRSYARELLEQTGEVATLRARHADYYAGTVEYLAPLLLGPDQTHWMDVLDTEWENMQAALDWWVQHGGAVGVSAAPALRMAAGLNRFWIQRGRLTEGRAWLGRLLEAIPLDENVATDPTLRASRGEALIAASTMALVQWDVAAAQRLLDEAATLGDPAGDGVLPARVRLWQGARYVNDAQLEAALGVLADAIATLGANAAAPASERAFAWLQLGRALLGLERPRDAALALETSVRGFEAAGDLWAASLPMVLLGSCLRQLGQTARAVDLCQAAVDRAQRTGDSWVTAVTLQELGRTMRDIGHLEEARRSLEESAVRFQSMGNQTMAAANRADLLALPSGSAAAHPTLPTAAPIGTHEVTQSLQPEWATPRVPEAPGTRSTAPAPSASRASRTSGERVLPPGSKLTARETEVLRLVAQGLSNVQVAERLVISPVTVSAHLRVIYSKLDVSSRTAAARVALDLGLV